VSPVAIASAVVLAVALGVVLAGPLHALLARFVHRPDFAKVYRYLTLALVVVGLGALLRPWRDVPDDLWGLRGPPGRTLRLVGAGVGTMAVLLAALAALHFAVGLIQWDRWDGVAKAEKRAWKFGLAALPFALVEEAFFRGWLADRCARRFRPFAAAAVAAFVFAALHAARKSAAPDDVVAGVAGALAILGAWASRFGDVADFGPSFVGLLLFAFALEGARRRYGTLAFGVGAHAAVYVLLQVHSALTDPTPDPSLPAGVEPRSWLGSKWLYDGVPGLVLLAGMAFVLWPRRAAEARGPRSAGGSPPTGPSPSPGRPSPGGPPA
jgi:membrane protease YdiL (CAAX protease family)